MTPHPVPTTSSPPTPPAGTRWAVATAAYPSPRLDELLADGWEPFAVDDRRLFLRALVTAAAPPPPPPAPERELVDLREALRRLRTAAEGYAAAAGAHRLYPVADSDPTADRELVAALAQARRLLEP